MSENFKHYLLLNFTVFIWGFTGVLGREISLNANEIVFHRTAIAFISLLIIGYFFKKTPKISLKTSLALLFTGAIVGLHWFCFFFSIKVSKVEIAVVCMSSATLFTAFLEPLFFKRKVLMAEILLSFAIVAGIILIIGFEPEYLKGILIGLIAALLAALFNVLNGRFIQRVSSFQISKYEMLGGCLTMGIILIFLGQFNAALFEISFSNWIYLLVLGLICTTAAFLISVWLMKFLSPFTVSMSINLEPIYAILIVMVLNYFQGKPIINMSLGFYLGSAIIIGAIFVNAYLKKKKNKRLKF